MNEQIYDRDRRLGRSELLNDFRLIGEAILSPFETLTRIQFAAPWRDEQAGHDAC